MHIDDMLKALRDLRRVHGGLPVEFVGGAPDEPTVITEVIAVDDDGDDVTDRDDVNPVAIQLS